MLIKENLKLHTGILISRINNLQLQPAGHHIWQQFCVNLKKSNLFFSFRCLLPNSSLVPWSRSLTCAFLSSFSLCASFCAYKRINQLVFIYHYSTSLSFLNFWTVKMFNFIACFINYQLGRLDYYIAFILTLTWDNVCNTMSLVIINGYSHLDGCSHNLLIKLSARPVLFLAVWSVL